ncbi:MAG: galactokinase [Desulfamplus sp.]|nr:galactokinase [Desulfamplus sp.]
MNFRQTLEKQEIKASVPCRVDLGGTLDISTFFLPLNHLNPSTFNIALDMRTTVTLTPWRDGYIKISSKGFESAEFEAEKAPFNHPMGLMFAVVKFFNGDGVHVKIESSSPPRSALGGSSSAAVAMVAAFQLAVERSKYQLTREESKFQLKEKDLFKKEESNSINLIDPTTIALIAHYIESSVAGVPCGLQDQLAAAYGGVNSWYWKMGKSGVEFIQEVLVESDLKSYLANNISGGNISLIKVNSNVNPSDIKLNDFNNNILVAYCGIPHVSSDINGRWVKSFLAGEDRDKWHEIIKITHNFSNAVKNKEFKLAASLMNQETLIRLSMTPDVLDKTGKLLFECASKIGCGARFTGAGGGGCLWAIGEKEDIENLKADWKNILDKESEARLLDTMIDFKGIVVN